MPLPIKRAGKRDWRFSEFTRLSNRRPLIAAGRHGIVVQLDIRRQREEAVGVCRPAVDLLRQICQFRTVADLVGIRLRTSTTGKLFRNRADPHIRAILIIQQRDVVLTVILVLGGLLVLVFLVLVIPIGLVGVLAVAVGGVLILVTGIGGLFVPAVLGVLALAVLALDITARGSVSCTSVALDDGRTAAAHHLRGKGRGGHQRQREHHAHQQAHDAPGHTACPFLHVICLLSLLNVSI